MSKVTHFIYTDASFAPRQKIACLGAMIFTDHKSHSENIFANAKVQTTIISERNNIRAELRSLLWAVKSIKFKPDDEVVVYTDCQAISSLLLRRERLQKSNFSSISTGKSLNNADLYQEFFSLNDQVNWQIIWVKGHKAQQKRSSTDDNFRYLDHCVRKLLRSYTNAC